MPALQRSDTVVLTGATGFVGRHTLRRLANQGVHTLVLVRTEQAGDRLRVAYGSAVEPIVGDLAHGHSLNAIAAQMKSPVPLLHLASAVDRGRKVAAASAEQLILSNVLGTARLLDALGPSLSRIIHVGTADVYGHVNKLPIRETHPVNPATHYAATRLASENHTTIIGTALDIPIVKLRLAQVYGPGDPHRKAIPEFIRRVASGKPPVVAGTGRTVRQYVYVDDVVDAILGALACAHSTLCNIAGPETIRIHELADLVVELSGRDLKPQMQPAPNEPGDCTFDLAHASDVLGWQPTTPLRVGLRHHLDWFESQNDRALDA